ncbi:unnamed protein product, partial [Meganyctiphanes norvegica]
MNVLLQERSAADSYQAQVQAAWQKSWNQTQSLLQNLRFRERGPLKSWRPETMAEAIHAVLKEGLSLSQAARKYDIPYPTFVLYANRVHNLLGPSQEPGDMRPKGRGRPQRILLGSWPEEQIKGVIKAVVFRDTSMFRENEHKYKTKSNFKENKKPVTPVIPREDVKPNGPILLPGTPGLPGLPSTPSLPATPGGLPTTTSSDLGTPSTPSTPLPVTAGSKPQTPTSIPQSSPGNLIVPPLTTPPTPNSVGSNPTGTTALSASSPSTPSPCPPSTNTAGSTPSVTGYPRQPLQPNSATMQVMNSMGGNINSHNANMNAQEAEPSPESILFNKMNNISGNHHENNSSIGAAHNQYDSHTDPAAIAAMAASSAILYRDGLHDIKAEPEPILN